MEELFFWGVIWRYLEDRFHAGVAVGAASLPFVLVHTGASVGAGGELVSLGMFFTYDVVLGVGYHLIGNLFVPLIGHVLYNAVQIILRAVEVAG